jgi:hypothetical protein
MQFGGIITQPMNEHKRWLGETACLCGFQSLIACYRLVRLAIPPAKNVSALLERVAVRAREQSCIFRDIFSSSRKHPPMQMLCIIFSIKSMRDADLSSHS